MGIVFICLIIYVQVPELCSLIPLTVSFLGSSRLGSGLHFLSLFHILCVLVIQSCLTLCDHIDCSPPGSSVYGILQARTSEWVPDPRIKPGSPALQADSLIVNNNNKKGMYV